MQREQWIEDWEHEQDASELEVEPKPAVSTRQAVLRDLALAALALAAIAGLWMFLD